MTTRNSSGPPAETHRKQPDGELQGLLRESRRDQAGIAALLEGARAVLEYRDFQDAARAIFNSCKELIGATSGYVALLNEESEENEVLFLDSGGMPCTVDPTLPIRGLREKVYQYRIAVFENAFPDSQWARFLPEGHSTLENVLFAPLTIDRQVVGLLGIANKPGGFNNDDARLATAFGELAAIALRNSRTLEALESSEQRFRSLTQSANDGIISIDHHGNIVFFNDAAAKMFGRTANEIVGKPLNRVIPERFQAAHQRSIHEVIETGESKILGKTVEVIGLRADGGEFPVELSLSSWKSCEETFFTGILRDVTERNDALKAMRAAQKELATRSRVADVFLTAKDDQIHADVLAIVLDATQSKYGYFGYLDEENNLVCPSMTRDIWKKCQIPDKNIVFPRESWGGLWGDSLINGETLYWNGPLKTPDGHIPLHGALVAPIMHDGTPIGQFAVANKDSDYTEEDKELLDSIAAHVAPVLHAKLQTERLAREQQEAEQKARSVAAFPAENPDPVMRARHDGTLIFANESSRPLLNAWGREVGQALPESLSKTISDVFVSNTPKDVDVECDRRTIVLRLVPVAEAGYVNLYGRDITERKSERRVLEITNCHVKMRPLLDEFLAEVKRFTGCTAVGIRILDENGDIPYEAYDGFPDEFYKLEGPLSIENDRCMCINVVKGETDAQLPFYTKGGSFWMNGTTQFLANVDHRDKGETRNVCNRFGFESVALIPIRLADRVLGLIHVADQRKNAIPEEVVESLERIGMQLGTAVQRVRAEEGLREANEQLEIRVRQRTAELIRANDELQRVIAQRQRLEKRVQEIGTRQQQRIGQELHDGVGQELTGLGYLAASLHRKLRATDSPEAESAAELAQAIPNALGQIKAIVKGLIPLEVGARDLVPAIRAMAANIEERTGISCSYESNGSISVQDDNVAVQLYRIAQEAVTNAVKHAQADHIELAMSVDSQTLVLEVRDDGVGIASHADNSSGSGMHIMRHRADVIGGTLTVERRDRGGTLIICSLPWKDPHERS